MERDKIILESQSFLIDLIQEFTMHPEEMKFSVIDLNHHIVLNLTATASDTGRIIGRQGSHFVALRDLLQLYSIRKLGIEVKLGRMDDPTISRERVATLTEFEAKWSSTRIMNLARRVAGCVLSHGVQIATVVDIGKDSIIELVVSSEDDEGVIRRLSHLMTTIFNAIGKVHRRGLHIKISPVNSDPSEKQPATADGRFVKTVVR